MHKHPLADAASWFVSPSELVSLFVSAFVDDSGDFKSSLFGSKYKISVSSASVSR